ncbi:hypothetical protein SAFG77S_11616 [Streptomyces afghaniensis]
MGTQASFIKFKDMTTTKKELRKYQKRDKSDDVVDIVALEKIKKDIFPSKEGEESCSCCRRTLDSKGK